MQPKRKGFSSRLRAKRTNVMKEIEAWVLKDTDLARETSRYAGNLSENITEERLLRARLVELGKERFKFLTHTTYEHQNFQDNQKKKFRKILAERNSSRQRSSPAWSKGGSYSQNKFGSRGPVDTPYSQYQSGSSPLPRPKTVQFLPTMFQGGYVETSDYGMGDTRPNTVVGLFFRDKLPETGNQIPPGGLSRESTRTPSLFINRPISQASTALSNYGDETYRSRGHSNSKQSRYGSKFKSVTGDPRYAKLEGLLSPNYVSKTKLNVVTIIDKVNSLQNTKCILEDGSDMDKKVSEFIIERGLTILKN